MSECTIPTCTRPTVDTGFICWPDTEHLAENLRWVAANAGELATTIAKQSRTGGAAARGSSDDRLPIDWAAIIDRDTIHATLTAWARDMLTIRTGLQPPPDTIPGIATWIADHITWYRQRDYAAQVWDELGYTVSTMRSAIDSRGERQFIGPCGAEPEPGQQCEADVYARPGAAFTTCSACGTQFDVAARRDWLLDLARDRLEPASVIATIVQSWTPYTITSAAVRKWIERSRLQAAGTDPATGRTLYPVSRALHLAEVAARRKQYHAYKQQKAAA